MRVNWSSIIVTGISGITITMPDIAHVSIFMDNDLTHITDDHFEIKLIARLLNQIYVVQPPMLPPRYDCKVQPCHALLGYPFHNTAAHM